MNTLNSRMRSGNNMKRIVIVTIAIVLLSATVAPARVVAQRIPGTAVPIELDGEGLSGIIGGVNDAVIGSACQTADAFQVADSSLGQGLNFLGENSSLVTKLQSQLTAVNGAITCWNGVVQAADASAGITGGAFFPNQKANNKRQYASDQLVPLKQIQKQLEAQLRVASQSFWKAILIGLMVKQADRFSEKLVQQLNQKFKINNYLGYIDALTNTVYANRMIAASGESNQTQIAIRSILNNPIFIQKLHPAAQRAADAYLGSKPGDIRFDDPQFWGKLALAGSAQANPGFQQLLLEDKALQVKMQAQQAAVAEVSQSAGFKAPQNNCAANAADQRSIDQEYQLRLDEFEDRQKLFTGIQSSSNPNPNDLDRARTDFESAQQKLDDFPFKFNRVVKEICEGIASPATTINNTIKDLIGTQIKHFGDYNDNNLPLFQKVIVSVADNLIRKNILGENLSKADILNETRTITQQVGNTIPRPSSTPVGTGTGSGDSGGTATQPVPLLSYEQIDANQYAVRVNVETVAGVTGYELTGPNIGGSGENTFRSTNSIDFYRTFTVTVTGTQTFTVRAFGGSNQTLQTASVQIVAPQPQVSGAVVRVPFEPRGPMLAPRGNQ